MAGEPSQTLGIDNGVTEGKKQRKRGRLWKKLKEKNMKWTCAADRF